MNAPSQLRAFVERIEVIETEIKDRNDDKRDIYAEAKSAGFDVKALKTVIARRRKDPSELTEHESLVDLYEAQLGTGNATRVHAHEEPRVNTAAANPALSPSQTLSADDLGIPPFLKRERVTA
jgi:uncharacterized protein (UPF0335 family)